jgi:hypothetical protein
MLRQAGDVSRVRPSGIHRMQLQQIRCSRPQGASLTKRNHLSVSNASTHRNSTIIQGLRPWTAIRSRPSAGQGVEAPSFGLTMLALGIVASTLLGLDAGYARAQSGEASHEHQHHHAMSSSQLLIAPNPQADTADDTTAQAAVISCTPVTATERVNAWGDLGGYTHRCAQHACSKHGMLQPIYVEARRLRQFSRFAAVWAMHATCYCSLACTGVQQLHHKQRSS